MSDLAVFPDAEQATAEVLAGLATAGSGSWAIGSPLPYIRVQRTGGADDRYVDTADVEVSVFAADASGAKTLAEQVRQRLISGPFAGTSFGTSHGRIGRVHTVTAPVLLPAGSGPGSVRQVTASYQVSARR